MPLPAVVCLVALVAGALAGRGRPPATGWPAFGLWAGAGALACLASISFALGLFLMPFAAVALFLVARRRPGPAALGAVAGAGAVVLAVGALVGPGWVAAGAVAVAAGAGGFALVRRRGIRST
jgi:hypothetical protein